MNEILEASDGLKYKGKVKITLKKDGKKLRETIGHNEGLYPLFRAVAGCLIGGDYSEQMPQYLEAYQGNSPLRSRCKILDKHIDETTESVNKATAVFIANIPFASLPLGGTAPITKLELYSQFTGGNALARISLNEADRITLVSSGYSAMVEWSLVIENIEP